MPPVIADKTAEDASPIKSISSPVCHHFGKLEVIDFFTTIIYQILV